MKLRAWWHPTDLQIGVGLTLPSSKWSSGKWISGWCFSLALLIASVSVEWGRDIRRELERIEMVETMDDTSSVKAYLDIP